jgi:hypothetical protein
MKIGKTAPFLLVTLLFAAIFLAWLLLKYTQPSTGKKQVLTLSDLGLQRKKPSPAFGMRPTLVVLADPSCEICISEIIGLGRDESLLHAIDLDIVCEGDNHSCAALNARLPANLRSQSFLSRDSNATVSKMLRTQIFPSSGLFDKSGRLICRWKGEVSTYALERYVSKYTETSIDK